MSFKCSVVRIKADTSRSPPISLFLFDYFLRNQFRYSICSLHNFMQALMKYFSEIQMEVYSLFHRLSVKIWKKALEEVRNIWICFNWNNKSSINSVFFEEAITFTSINVRVHVLKKKKKARKRFDKCHWTHFSTVFVVKYLCCGEHKYRQIIS